MQIAIPAVEYAPKFFVAESGVSMKNIGGDENRYLKLYFYYIPNTILEILFIFKLFPVELKIYGLTTVFDLFVVFLAYVLFRRRLIVSGKPGCFMRKGEKC